MHIVSCECLFEMSSLIFLQKKKKKEKNPFCQCMTVKSFFFSGKKKETILKCHLLVFKYSLLMGIQYKLARRDPGWVENSRVLAVYFFSLSLCVLRCNN